MASLISVQQAQEIVLSSVVPGPTVHLPLRHAVNRTLAEDVVCDIDYPPFDRAMMDGYALRSADTTSVPAVLQIVGQAAAGTTHPGELAPGQAVQVNTGAPMPAGCDAVARVEDTAVDGDRVTILAVAHPGQHIARRAESVRAGQTVLEAGTRLTAGRIAIAAAAGAPVVAVYEEPGVAILVTGDELVDVDRVPSGPQIRDSNRYVLDALVRQCHCRPVDLGVAHDDRETLTAKIKQGLAAGFLCITGGVSMGEFDFVPDCLGECGATIRFHKLAVKP
ncbi:MAG: molybdopterin molybdotransferase MoeA, partial [Planctomycetota bacterium]